MARRFLDPIRDDITNLLADNTTGDISAADLRGILTDMIDSTVQDECVIYGLTVADDVDTTPTFAPITTGFDTTVGGDGSFLIPNQINGTIQSSSTAGFTYNIRGQITIIASNGDRFEFCILRNGTDVMGAIGGITGDGNNDPVGVTVFGTNLSAPSDAVYSIGVRSPDGNESLDVQSIGLQLTIQPTNNP